MSSSAPDRAPARRRPAFPGIRWPSRRGFDPRALARRLVHFWLVWSMLLLVHEAGHAYVGWRQGLEVQRVTVGVGPALWRGTVAGTETVLRLVPLAGMTSTRAPSAATASAADIAATVDRPSTEWGEQVAILSGGVLATLLLAVGFAGLVAMIELTTRSRSVWARMLLADAIVLSVFNLLPVPPLDGGRALVVTIAALRGEPLSSDALFWLQLGGLAVAVVPMLLWTNWTARIDRVAMRWGAPVSPNVPGATA